ncbi:WD repeat and HMG-box DNA-binding protein 1 [Cricetulus griseus]|uniref:WD repeat and HMG-box DNA-binding protein 1 n=1 Tax=Cricetulus griseus TaxID=10029 RepID=G3H7B6_CRIGR|nr:WD repeat and HMG-box DNA-binding protein 1 [Cricetulus griseus]
MRYGHTEGHTDVCFDDSGSFIVTCGSDGDVRMWEDLDDDDPKSINVGEKAFSCALKNGKLVTAVSNNTVQVYTFPEGVPDGILTRFTTNANHVVFNGDGTKIAAGSSDFLVKVVDVMDNSQQQTFRGHDAPVLSLSFDPKDIFLASSSCDGTVRVWNISDQACAVSWPVLQKCNDVVNAKSICRLAWQPGTGKTLNIVTWSPCGQYLAAGTTNGLIVVWNVETKDCMERVKHEKGYAICGLAWHPTYGRICYTDVEGNLGILENVCDLSEKVSSHKVSSRVEKDYNDLFDGDDTNSAGDFLNDNAVEIPSFSKGIINDDDDDDDLMLTGDRLRRRSHILGDDENSVGQGWAAAATTALLLRLFTIGGVQKEVFSLPGPVVSMTGHGEQLCIVYHRVTVIPLQNGVSHGPEVKLKKTLRTEKRLFKKKKNNQSHTTTVLVNSKEPAVSMSSTRSTNILDNMNKSSRKSTPLNRAANNEKSPVIKPLVPKPKSKQASAASYFQKRTSQADKTEEVKENPKNPSPETPAMCLQNSENQRPKTGFQMWLEENRSHILSDNPDFSDEADIIKEGMVRFRVLSAEERKAWTNKAKGEIASDTPEVKKRKHEVCEAENQEEAAKENMDLSKKQKTSALSTNQKLSAFAFKQE